MGYLMNSSDELAILYNDKSILENHHASASFKIMLQPDCNILSGVDRTQYKQIRESILNNVLATDAAQHFDYLGKFKAKLAAGYFDMEDDADRRMVTSFATKCADMNNPTRPSKLSREWTERIMNEFFMQGDQEAKLNIPVSMFMDRNNTDIPKCQIGFIDFIVKPMFDAMVQFVEIHDAVELIGCNRVMWEQMAKEKEEEKKLEVEVVTIPNGVPDE